MRTGDENSTKVLLVGLDLGTEPDFDHSMEELKSLAEAACKEVVGIITQRSGEVNKAFYIGTGKVAEARDFAVQCGAEEVVFDNTLSPSQMRNLGKELGLPDRVVMRQPFPGPGLAVRIMGKITLEKLKTLQDADYILRDEVAKAGLDREIWQYFAVITSTSTVGVMGDSRTYENVIALRAVTSIDAMTADWARIPYEVLEKVSSRIVNEVEHANRVVYDITSKPPATIEWE